MCYNAIMSTVRQHELISVADYLDGEEISDVKHEYVAGAVFAMAGATIAHTIIATNLTRAAGNQLSGSPCREFNSDMKVRINLARGFRFYYPDAQVVCQSNPQSERFQDSPVFIFEVLSESTRRIDEGEKRDLYLGLSSVNAYVMLEQTASTAVIYQRVGDDFERSVLDQPDSIIKLRHPDVELSFEEIYRDIRFPARH